MNFKAVLFLFIISLGLLLGNGEDYKGQKRKWYVFIIITLLIMESCLRSISVGPDTRVYYYGFLNINYNSWSDIISQFKTAYLEGEGKDVGFFVFTKLVQVVSNDFNVFLFVCALIFFVPLGIILFRYSTNILQLVFAFSLYVALFNIVALSGIRQQIATGIAFISLIQLGKNHYLRAILFIIIGAFFHISLLIFLIVPIIKRFFLGQIKTIHLCSFVTIPFVIIYSGSIMAFLASFLANDYYAGYSYAEDESAAETATYIVLMELLSLFCYVAIKKSVVLKDSNYALMYAMLPLITITAPLISLNGAMIRVGQYFTLYMMLLVPMAIDSIFKANRRILYTSLIAILVLLDFTSNGNFQYYFFWQEPQV